MTKRTQTLDQFLLARIAEDEALALKARGGDPIDASLLYPYFIDCCNGVHVHCNPERLLAEVAAKRAIVQAYVEERSFVASEPHVHGGRLDGLRTTVAALATAHADHPDHHPEWRP